MSEKEFLGVDIREVWNYRLSSAVPTIDRSGGTWVVQLHNVVDGGEPVDSHDTGIVVTPNDQHDTSKIIPCFEWLYSVRDDYALDNIEAMKPQIAKIEQANQILSELGAS